MLPRILSYAELQEQNEQLREKLELLESRVKVTGKIMNAFLPLTEDNYLKIEVNPHLRFAGLVQARDEVSGDFISYKRLENGDAGLFIIDTPGHGVDSGAFVAGVKSYSDENMYKGLAPTEFLRNMYSRITRKHKAIRIPIKTNLNEQDFLAARLAKSKYENFFMVAAYAQFHWNEQRQLMEMNASFCGLPTPPIITHCNEKIEIAKSTRYEELLNITELKTCYLPPSSRVFFCTDGLTETTNPAGEELGDTIQYYFNATDWVRFENILKTLRNNYNNFYLGHEENKLEEFVKPANPQEGDDISIAAVEVV